MFKKGNIDMTTGPLFGKILLFAAPVVLTNLLQLLYNAADTVIVGKFDGSQALAAVGNTASVIHLVTNLFMGFSLGASVVTAQHKGAGEETEVSKTVHTAILTSVICGILVSVVGIIVSRPMLVAMETPDDNDVLEMAVLYIRIYFLGMPATMVYNFGAGIHRAVGDTRRPLYFLTLSGVINVLLNLLFVAVMRKGVAGVAAATVISQTLAAILVIISLCKSDGCIKLELRKLRIDGKKLARMAKIGLPAGIQNSLFSLSNVLIQSTLNTFKTFAMAGNTAAVSIEGFMNASVTGVSDAAMNFVGQNLGAKKYDRIRKSCLLCCLVASAISILLGTVLSIFGRDLLGIYADEAEVIDYGMKRLQLVASCYIIFALMQVFAGSLRGMGRSILPMMASLVCICGLRVVYLYTLYPLNPTLEMLYLSYPASWLAAMLVNMICYFVVSRRVDKVTAQTAQ